MEFKRIIIVLIITLTVLIGILFGTSYAWYAYSNAETKVEGRAKESNPTIIFSQNEYIYLREIMPIEDNDRYNYANKNSFTITIGEDLKDYETGIEISLKNVIMSDELKIANYKYELLQNGQVVGNGNFSNIGSDNNIVLMPMTRLVPTNYPENYNYELYIWLSEDGTDQNYLMNKAFSAKINVNSAIKR